MAEEDFTSLLDDGANSDAAGSMPELEGSTDGDDADEDASDQEANMKSECETPRKPPAGSIAVVIASVC